MLNDKLKCVRSRRVDLIDRKSDTVPGIGVRICTQIGWGIHFAKMSRIWKPPSLDCEGP